MCFMKTKIIYISGNEIFNIADIRTAFEEVRNALQLGTDTVLFGVPVDTDDAGFGTSESEETIQSEPVDISEETQITEPVIEDIDNPAESIVVQEPENQKQKRSRSRKESDQNQIIQLLIHLWNKKQKKLFLYYLCYLAKKMKMNQQK